MRKLRLHAKLYRAKAIDEAIELARDSSKVARLSRKRAGDYHEITIQGVEESDQAELLAELADAALQITVQLDRK